jgi:hypothetical protein
MPILSKLRRAVSENKIPEAEELAEWADSIIEGTLSDDTADIIDSDDLAEAPEEKIAGKYDPEDFDAMVSRVGQKAKEQQRKNPVDVADLARRMHGVLAKDRDVKTDEGLAGAVLGGAAGAALTKSPSGALTGASLGSNLQDEITSEEVDTGQYDAAKSPHKGEPSKDWDKNFREKIRQYGDELEKRQKEKENVKEDRDDLAAMLRIINR